MPEKKLTPKEIFDAQVKEFHADLSGELQKTALDFAEYIYNAGGYDYLGENICFTFVVDGNFNIGFGNIDSLFCTVDCGDYPVDESIKEFAWNNLHKCWYVKTNGEVCGGCHDPTGQNYIIFGRKIDKLCRNPIMFVNPSAEKLERIKKLYETWKCCLDKLKRTAK